MIKPIILGAMIVFLSVSVNAGEPQQSNVPNLPPESRYEESIGNTKNRVENQQQDIQRLQELQQRLNRIRNERPLQPEDVGRVNPNDLTPFQRERLHRIMSEELGKLRSNSTSEFSAMMGNIMGKAISEGILKTH